jgi:hypothetical protein
MAIADQKTCSVCGAGFECAAPRRGCWCESVQLSRETIAALGERFSNCLCPTCLSKAASGVLLPS